MLVDSHCHLDFEHFDEDRVDVLERMWQTLDWAVVVSVDLALFPRLSRLVESHNNLYCSVGIHPNHHVAQESNVAELVALSQHRRCVAIGETGMDFFRNDLSQEAQSQRFRYHLQAAKEVQKPVIVHMREADEATLSVLREERVEDCGGVMHCFSSTLDSARRALDMGMYISFSGNVTFKRNDSLREVAKFVPADRITVETDSPYLAPVPKRGKRNEPSYVQHVAQCIAEVRGMPLDEFSAITTANAAALFKVGDVPSL